MRSGRDVAIIFFFFLSPLLATASSIISSQNPNNNNHQKHDDSGSGGATTNIKPRELVCTSSCDSCVHRISRALDKASVQNTDQGHSKASKEIVMDTLEELKESVDDFAKLVLKDHDPVEAVKSVTDVGDTLRGDVLRNMTKAAMDMERAALRKAGQFLMMMMFNDNTMAVYTRIMDLVKDLRFMAGLVGLLAFVVAYGMSVWVVFVSPYILARTLPLWQIPPVERMVRGVYCRIMSCCVSGAAIGHFTGRGISGSFDGYGLIYSLFICLVNLVALERRATKVLLKKMNLEKQLQLKKGKMVPESSVAGERGSPVDKESGQTLTEPEQEALDEAVGGDQSTGETTDNSTIVMELSRLNATIKSLNSWSSFFNVLALVSLTWYLITLLEHVYLYT